MNQAKNMFYAYNVSTILVDLGVEVDTYQKRIFTNLKYNKITDWKQ